MLLTVALLGCIIGLLNLNWWIAIPIILVCGAVGARHSTRAFGVNRAGRGFRLLFMISAVSILTFNIGIQLRQAAAQTANLNLPNLQIGACNSSAAAASSNPTTGLPETVGGPTNTWTDFCNGGGTQGPTIESQRTVSISCKVRGLRVADGNTWWYRIGSPPWSNSFYASADAFYNDGATSGTLTSTPFVDPRVPSC